MPQPVTDRLVVLDDGEYYIELDASLAPEAVAPGFLKRRCYVSPTSPDGYECIGRFARNRRNHWMAEIDAAPECPEPGTEDCSNGDGTRTLGVHAQRVIAIVDLWMHRRKAHSRHEE